MSVMAPRALLLLVILGLSPVAGAAEGLFHLCRGNVRLTLTCCCDHDAKKAGKQPPHSEARLTDEKAPCCDELNAPLTPSQTPTTTPGHAWSPLPVALVPQSVSTVPPAPETLPPAWVRIRGVHRSTAPPLYVQHCSYLK